MSQPKNGKTQKFVVESMCVDTWEIFNDVVFATDHDDAIKRIEKVRPYAEGFNAMTIEEFKRYVVRIIKTTRKEASQDIKDLKASLG